MPTPYHFWCLKAISDLFVFSAQLESLNSLSKASKHAQKNLFTCLNLLLPIMCEHLRKLSVELNDRSWADFTNFPFFTVTTGELNEIWSFIERKKKRALWSYYESRLWSESGNCLWGNVKVSKISSTSKDGGVCSRGFILELRSHVGGLSFCLFAATLTNLWVAVFLKRGSSTLQENEEAVQTLLEIQVPERFFLRGWDSTKVVEVLEWLSHQGFINVFCTVI